MKEHLKPKYFILLHKTGVKRARKRIHLPQTVSYAHHQASNITKFITFCAKLIENATNSCAKMLGGANLFLNKLVTVCAAECSRSHGATGKRLGTLHVN